MEGVPEDAVVEDSGVAALAVSAAGAGLGAAGVTFGLGAGLGGVAGGAGAFGAYATALSGRGDVSLTATAAVSESRAAAVSAPDTAAVSFPGTEPDRRSPPQPVSVAEDSAQAAQSWMLQPLIVGSTLSLGADGPGYLLRSSLSAEC